mmetsp:Transcript_4044/g.12416  ORF Transcript_4044/g.12416 Transcript_4044/m.12416 type:complete len:102 (-) Transcript_4044:403-708(-)
MAYPRGSSSSSPPLSSSRIAEIRELSLPRPPSSSSASPATLAFLRLLGHSYVAVRCPGSKDFRFRNLLPSPDLLATLYRGVEPIVGGTVILTCFADLVDDS